MRLARARSSRPAAVVGTLALAGLTLAGAAACQMKKEPPPMPSAFHGRLAIRAAELAAPHPPKTLEEEAAALGYVQEHLMELFDSNKDGALEFDEWLESEFSTFVINAPDRDGRISYEIYRKTNQALVDGEQPLQQLEDETRRNFAEMDSGGKGYLTVDDYHDRAMATFRLNDINGDGKVTLDEMREASSRSAAHL